MKKCSTKEKPLSLVPLSVSLNFENNWPMIGGFIYRFSNRISEISIKFNFLVSFVENVLTNPNFCFTAQMENCKISEHNSIVYGYYKKRIILLKNILNKEQCQELKNKNAPFHSCSAAQLLWEKIKSFN
jgi:hypothetical protein